MANSPSGGDVLIEGGTYTNNSNLFGTLPLGPLQLNGGPTRTHALLPGSPAIDAGNNTGAPVFDQRGFPRIANGIVDIGTFEVQYTRVTTLADSGGGSLRQAIIEANLRPGDDTIVFQTGLTGTIQLNSALPTLSTNIAIVGPGASVLTVRRNTGGDYRLFTINSGVTASISGLTLTEWPPN